MKLIVILSVLLLLFTIPAFSELTVADLEKISSIVAESEKRLKEEIASVKAEVVASEKRLKEDIVESEKRLKAEIVAVKEEAAKSEVRLKEYINVRISEMDKRLNQIFILVMGLVAFIGVVVGVPQIIVAMQRKDISAQDKKIEALQQEIETRNQERIVRP